MVSQFQKFFFQQGFKISASASQATANQRAVLTQQFENSRKFFEQTLGLLNGVITCQGSKKKMYFIWGLGTKSETASACTSLKIALERHLVETIKFSNKETKLASSPEFVFILHLDRLSNKRSLSDWSTNQTHFGSPI